MTCEHHAKTQGSNDWEEIIAPFDCSYYSLMAPVGQTFDKCCDPSAASSYVLGLGTHAVLAPPIALPGHRWKVGDVITYVRSSQPVNLYFLK